MHPLHVKQAALDLIAAGHNDCEVSRRLGVPRRTIMDWRRPTYVSLREYALETCPRCWRTAKPMRFTPADYAELLGLYLGMDRSPRTPAPIGCASPSTPSIR
jgi:Homeodomain-like domain